MPRFALSTVLLGAVLTCAPAMAQSVAPAPARPPVAATPPKALSPAEMAGINGGSEVSVEVLNRQQLTGMTTGNTINAGALSSGQINFEPGSLSGFNGIGNFVLNTGANNTLQGAISVSVVTTPPPP
ncbi:hypothetical protein [Phenylobacterium sp.]|uniref:hypothetical protein n=1 Tax=Phenylobacterium sp. TaxID=1871053 RepID=UPI00356593AF